MLAILLDSQLVQRDPVFDSPNDHNAVLSTRYQVLSLKELQVGDGASVLHELALFLLGSYVV